MSTDHDSVLAVAIQYLERLKAEGQRFVCLTPDTLDWLRKPVSVAKPRVPETITPPQPSAPVGQAASVPPPVPLAAKAAMEPTPPKTPEDKAQAIAMLRKQVLACVKCPNLVAARSNVVFGVGDPNARLMFVGEAPGADEDAQGEPFVGAAGQLLTKIIQAMGLTRQTVYIGNILKCRPDTPGQASGNRKPTPAEMSVCFPWLQRQIELLQPEVIVALGATAVEGLLGHCSGITRLRGNWQSYRDIPVMPTYHPSYLLRNGALTEKRKVWEDMLQVMTKLGMPISTKQQNYFLKA